MGDFALLKGWAVTYLINLRGGGPSTGYVSSGFFGGNYFSALIINTNKSLSLNEGLAGGRIVLIQVTKLVCAIRQII